MQEIRVSQELMIERKKKKNFSQHVLLFDPITKEIFARCFENERGLSTIIRRLHATSIHLSLMRNQDI